MIPDPIYHFKTQARIYRGEKSTYYLATLPTNIADAIKTMREGRKRLGWGSVRVELTVGKTIWRTSIFPSSESKSFIFLIKQSVRKAETIAEGTRMQVSLKLLD